MNSDSRSRNSLNKHQPKEPYVYTQNSESDMDEDNEPSYAQFTQEYFTTNLVSAQNVTVADVTVSEVSDTTIARFEKDIYDNQVRDFTDVDFIDPYEVLRAAKRQGLVQTLIPYDDIPMYTSMASELMRSYIEEAYIIGNQDSQKTNTMFQQLIEQVTHDHRGTRASSQKKCIRRKLSEPPKSSQPKSFFRQSSTHSKESMFEEARFLLLDCNLPLNQVSKRLKIKISRLKKIQQEIATSTDDAFRLYKQRPRFKKIHQRARDFIEELTNSEQHPLSLSEIKSLVNKKMQLSVSKSMLHKFLKEVLGLSYRNINQVSNLHNKVDALLQRQYASAMYINYLFKEYNIINIDESVINKTQNRRRGWMAKHKKNLQTWSTRIYGLSIIAGVSSKGDFMYTLNMGKNNSFTFLLFLYKVCLYLGAKDSDWRSNTIIMLDNARYHKSRIVREKADHLKIPIMFLGPYQFKLAPIEMMFSYIKNRDLNPLNTRVNRKELHNQYLKELTTLISKVDRDWIRPSYMHVLIHAVEFLSLKPI